MSWCCWLLLLSFDGAAVAVVTVVAAVVGVAVADVAIDVAAIGNANDAAVR